MLVSEIVRKITDKIEELDGHIKKFTEESETTTGPRKVQVQSYVTRLKHEKTFLQTLIPDIESVEMEAGTVNGDDEYAEDIASDDYSDEIEEDGDDSDDEDNGSSY